MFNDKDSMLDMFETSMEKRNWKHILVTSELFGEEHRSLTTKEIGTMHHEWKETIKQLIQKEDAAYVINQGNVFCLIHNTNVVNFERDIKEVQFVSTNYKGGLRSSILYLSAQETEFLLKMS